MSIEYSESHPEGKIRLLDGSLVVGYSHEEVVRSQASLTEKVRSLFVENAFFFFDNAEKILADSRMFLARVPVVNGLKGVKGGGENPLLGVYLEWWKNYPCSHVEIEGKEALIWRIACLDRGDNRCLLVDREGKEYSIKTPDFDNILESFYEVSHRYDSRGLKRKYASYTLADVLWLLKNDTASPEIRERIEENCRLRSQIATLNRQLSILRDSIFHH